MLHRRLQAFRHFFPLTWPREHPRGAPIHPSLCPSLKLPAALRNAVNSPRLSRASTNADKSLSMAKTTHTLNLWATPLCGFGFQKSLLKACFKISETLPCCRSDFACQRHRRTSYITHKPSTNQRFRGGETVHIQRLKPYYDPLVPSSP